MIRLNVNNNKTNSGRSNLLKTRPIYEKTTAKSSNSSITQHSATLDVGGNMVVNSSGDVNIAASNVNVTGNALLNVDGNLNITSAAEKTSSSNKTEDIDIGTMKLTNDSSHASFSSGVSGSGSRFEDSLNTATQKSSNINIGGSLLANVTNNLAAANSGNLTLAASKLTVNGNSIIKTAGDFNLTDAQETSSYSSKQSTLEVEAGAKVGNAYVDAGYAWKAVVDAQKKAVQAAEKLKRMQKLKDEGKASDKAVELAAAQVVLAQTAVATSIIAAAAATAGAASAASSSMGTGFYGAGYLNLTASGVKNTTETSLSKASNFIGYGDIDIASNNNLNVLGSMLASVNGNVTLAAANDIKIEAGTNTISQNSKQETIYGGGSVGNNGVQLNIGMSQGESEYDKTFYTNSQVSAENGTLTLTTGNDANISGANLLAKNTILNIGNNLNVSSKQTEEDSSSSGFGFNVGGGVGNGVNVNAGFNISSGDMHRMWTDNITTIKGTDSMVINTGTKIGSTGDLNLTGAAILSDNMTLNVKGSTNKKDLEDSFTSESMSIGVSTNVAVGGNQATVPGTGGQPNQFPGGSTSLSGSYNQNESNRTTYATIGGLNTKLTSDTQDMTNGDFEGGLTVDLRLISPEGRKDITKNFKELGQNLKTMREAADKSPLKIGAILNAPNTLLEGAIYTFSEKKDTEDGSRLRIVNLETGEIEFTTDAAVKQFYALNGINNTPQDIIDSYFTNADGSKITSLVERENPTHGPLGDLVESGLGKIFSWIGLPNAIAMNKIAEDDIAARKDMPNAVNLYHSQGTIIGEGAMQAYANDYMKPITYSDPTTGEIKTIGYTNQINPTQQFVAVGPAVTESGWINGVKDLKLNVNIDPISKEFVNYDYTHDSRDFVQPISAPTSPLDFGRGLYLIGQDVGNALTGNTQDLNFNHHSVTNPMYYQYLTGGSSNLTSTNKGN